MNGPRTGDPSEHERQAALAPLASHRRTDAHRAVMTQQKTQYPTAYLYLTEDEALDGIQLPSSRVPPLPDGARLGTTTVYPIPELEYWLSFHAEVGDAFVTPTSALLSTTVRLSSGAVVPVALTARQLLVLQDAVRTEGIAASALLNRIASDGGLEDYLEWGGFQVRAPKTCGQ